MLGRDGMSRLCHSRVIIFGLGGVGSWAAEALARTGVGHLTLVDADVVALSNINRQLPALDSTIGQSKVSVMAQRLKDINPEIEVTERHEMYCEETAATFCLEDYDCVIDAIDSLSDKARLILQATSVKVPFFSAMGAALKADPTKLQVTEFWKVKGCPLAAALRNKFKRAKVFPQHKFQCVFSPELLVNREAPDDLSGAMNFNKARTNGALVTVTASAGMILASLAINALTKDK